MTMIAYGMLREAHRSREEWLAVRAQEILSVRMGERHGGFEQWALVSIWRDPSRAMLSDDFQSRLKDHLENLQEPIVGPRAWACQRSPECHNNLKLVDALATISLESASLDPEPDSRLGSNEARDGAKKTLLRLPKLMEGGYSDLLDAPVILSDPPRNPLAYHHLTVMVLTLLLEEPALSEEERLSVQESLDALMRGSLASLAPDGDLSFYGRGQRQLWTYAAGFLAMSWNSQSSDSEIAGLSTGGVMKVWPYLRESTLQTSAGTIWDIVPATDLAGSDFYANHTSYNGLLLMILEQSVRKYPTTFPRAIKDSSQIWRDPATGLLTLKNDDWWIAWQSRSTHPTDVRYASGIIALKYRSPKGWKALLAPRPITQGDAWAEPGLRRKEHFKPQLWTDKVKPGKMEGWIGEASDELDKSRADPFRLTLDKDIRIRLPQGRWAMDFWTPIDSPPRIARLKSDAQSSSWEVSIYKLIFRSNAQVTVTRLGAGASAMDLDLQRYRIEWSHPEEIQLSLRPGKL
jgi:hypothetical protein